MKCHACESTAIYIDGLCEGCYDDLCSGADDATMVAEKLVGVINRQHERIAELEFGNTATMARITELEAQLAAALATIERAF